jgi:hypothetical protein
MWSIFEHRSNYENNGPAGEISMDVDVVWVKVGAPSKLNI